jgi:hypothetical protein
LKWQAGIEGAAIVIYMVLGEQRVIVMEPANVEKIKEGNPLIAPDGSVLIAYCPDSEWLAAKISEMIADGNREFGAEQFDALLRDGLKRAPIMRKGEPKMRKVFDDRTN